MGKRIKLVTEKRIADRIQGEVIKSAKRTQRVRVQRVT